MARKSSQFLRCLWLVSNCIAPCQRCLRLDMLCSANASVAQRQSVCGNLDTPAPCTETRAPKQMFSSWITHGRVARRVGRGELTFQETRPPDRLNAHVKVVSEALESDNGPSCTALIGIRVRNLLRSHGHAMHAFDCRFCGICVVWSGSLSPSSRTKC